MKIDLIIGCISFVVISVFLYLFYTHKINSTKKKKKKQKDVKDIVEIKYLMLTYNLKKEKLIVPKIILLISILDALIISIVFVVIEMLPWAIIWQLLVGFVLLLGFIYAVYSILGKILVKRGYDK